MDKPIFKKHEMGFTLWLGKDGRYYSGRTIPGGTGPAFTRSSLIGKTFKCNASGAWAYGLKVKVVGVGKDRDDVRAIVEGEKEPRDIAFYNLAPTIWRLKKRR